MIIRAQYTVVFTSSRKLFGKEMHFEDSSDWTAMRTKNYGKTIQKAIISCARHQ